MIRVETDSGFTGKYLNVYLYVGSMRIDLGDGNSLNETEAGKVANELQAVVNELRLFSNRNTEAE